MQSKLRRFWIRVTADRKRFGALCAALAVGLLLWARLIVVSHPPRTALASDQSMIPNGGGPGANVPLMHENLSGEIDARVNPTRAALGLPRQPLVVQLDADPTHDPFVISPRYFPNSKTFSDTANDAGKSRVETAEEPAEQAEARITTQLLALAERFTLEAVLGNSMAVIGGRKYRVGDSISSRATADSPVANKESARHQFKLVEIKRRSVILECEGRKFELQMAAPGT